MEKVIKLEYYVGNTLNEFYFDSLLNCNNFIKLRNLKDENCSKYIIYLINEKDIIEMEKKK